MSYGINFQLTQDQVQTLTRAMALYSGYCTKHSRVELRDCLSILEILMKHYREPQGKEISFDQSIDHAH